MPLFVKETDGSGPSVRFFPARPSSLGDVRRFIREQAAETSLHGDLADDLVLAVSEAAANSTLHSDSGRIEVTWRQVEGGAEVLVRDQGLFKVNGDRPIRRGLGFGLRLISALCDEVSITRGTRSDPGTRVRLVKYER
jgi:anti-sigma regulatory factor (Ser/Thr protein kinase)